MEIHEVAVFEENIHHLDPVRGMVLRKEQVLKQGTTHRLVSDGVQYDAVDGTFDVPADVAAFYLATPGWFPGPNPFPADTPAPKSRAKTAAKAE